MTSQTPVTSRIFEPPRNQGYEKPNNDQKAQTYVKDDRKLSDLH